MDLQDLIAAAPMVESGECRARFATDEQGRPALAFQVRDSGAWRSEATGTTALVDGLNLIVENGHVETDRLVLAGTLSMPASDGTTGSAQWHGDIRARLDGWIQVAVEVDLPVSTSARPEFILWLGTFITMNERQTYTFRQTRLIGPTVNCQDLRGNDLPVVYYYDPRVRVETAVYVPATHLRWTDHRFLDYRCDLKTDYETLSYGIGLLSNAGAQSLTAEKHRFVWYVRQQTRDTAPGEWEAQQELIASIEQFIPKVDTAPVSWARLAAGALVDLLDASSAQITVDGYTGHPAYVRDTSEVRAEDRRPDALELMTQIDVIPPLALYLKLHPELAGQEHLTKLLATLPLFHLPAQHWMGNRFPATEWPIEDTWYFLENALIKLPWVASITGDDRLWDIFMDALSGAEELAQNVHHVFPLFVDIDSRTPVKSSTNYSVAGLYAYGQMLAYHHTGDSRHLGETRTTLATLYQLPVDRMWHEPQQLGFTAAAAALLSEQTDDLVAAAWARNLLATQLRMAYWDDRGPHGDPLTGMFQACASLLYPAFKENVESVLPWSHLLQMNLAPTTLLLRLLDAQRRHNSAYFDVLSGGTAGPGLFIPLENLGTVELPEHGRLGKELYGAGEVFWLYLMLEALACSRDPEVMVCSLDIPSLSALADFPPPTRSFMVFNATTVARSTIIDLPALPDGDFVIRWADSPERHARAMDGLLEVEITLAAGQAHRLDVVPASSAASAPLL